MSHYKQGESIKKLTYYLSGNLFKIEKRQNKIKKEVSNDKIS